MLGIWHSLLKKRLRLIRDRSVPLEFFWFRHLNKYGWCGIVNISWHHINRGMNTQETSSALFSDRFVTGYTFIVDIAQSELFIPHDLYHREGALVSKCCFDWFVQLWPSLFKIFLTSYTYTLCLPVNNLRGQTGFRHIFVPFFSDLDQNELFIFKSSWNCAAILMSN